MLKPFFSIYVECGTDEAGRGCLAGPVTAAAVILPKGFKNKKLNDSKLLNVKSRNNLRKIIIDNALDYAISHVSVEKIDEINILNASILAMNQAINQLQIKPKFIIVDGNRFESNNMIPFKCIIKGDSKYLNIAAASILAKTSRDDLMINLSKKNPNYGWEQNKGYPTKTHREAIKKYGISIHHRKSFKLIKNQQ